MKTRNGFQQAVLLITIGAVLSANAAERPPDARNLQASIGAEPPFVLDAADGPSRYGEPINGFPSWYDRMMTVLINRARSDPAADLAACSDCADAHCFTSALSPMQWHIDLNRVARFHAANLTDSACGMRHESPCDLVANISSLYPDTCAGEVSCACEAGTEDCLGTSHLDRMSLFGVIGGWRGENIAGYGDPFLVFYLWLHEPTSNPACQWTLENGHRWNILGSYTFVGIGAAGNYVVQDFWGAGALSEKILAGAHYPQSGTTIDLRANWFDGTAPNFAEVNVDGTCYPMSIERGTGANGTYLSQASTHAGCRRYYFIFEDGGGSRIDYPTTGSFGIDCPEEWSPTRPDECEPNDFTVRRFTSKFDVPTDPEAVFSNVQMPWEDPDAVLSSPWPFLLYGVDGATAPIYLRKTATSIEIW